MEEQAPVIPGEGTLARRRDAHVFLQDIGQWEIKGCLFAESLKNVSDIGKELGEFTINIEKASHSDESCFLIQANSQGYINNKPCGTSITTYVSKKLETIEESHHEYMKLETHNLDRKCHMVRKDEEMVVERVITKGKEVKTETLNFPLSSLEGFVSEGSNLLLLRILSRRQSVPENLTFLSFDRELHICTSTYKKIGVKMERVETQDVEVFGIQRVMETTTWRSYFLLDGHLASRMQSGSSVKVKLGQMPAQREEEKKVEDMFEKKPLVWEEDMQMYSKFLDRKEELKASHATYVNDHPEMKALLSDFLQLLLLRKPDNVFLFAAQHFASFSHK